MPTVHGHRVHPIEPLLVQENILAVHAGRLRLPAMLIIIAAGAGGRNPTVHQTRPFFRQPCNTFDPLRTAPCAPIRVSPSFGSKGMSSLVPAARQYVTQPHACRLRPERRPWVRRGPHDKTSASDLSHRKTRPDNREVFCRDPSDIVLIDHLRPAVVHHAGDLQLGTLACLFNRFRIRVIVAMTSSADLATLTPLPSVKRRLVRRDSVSSSKQYHPRTRSGRTPWSAYLSS